MLITPSRSITQVTALALIALLAGGCEKSPVSSSSSDPGDVIVPLASHVPPTVCGETVTAMMADNGDGNGFSVGSARIANDAETLYVSLASSGDWRMTASHLHVTTDPDLVPRIGKGVAPGTFDQGGAHAPTHEVHFQVPLADLGGQDAVIAAHADVTDGVLEEGAWIDGDEIRPGGSWASYALYTPASCESSTTETIPTSGGSLQLGGATLDFENGALDEDTEVTITAVDVATLPPGALPGTAFDLDAGGVSFNAPVALTLDYDPADIPTGFDAADLSIWLLDEATEEWIQVPSTLQNGSVVAVLEHFSTYAVVPGFVRVEMRGWTPDPVAENDRSRLEVWIWNESGSALPSDPSFVLTVEGDIGGWAYSTGQCSLTSSATTHTFTCDNLVNPPSPGTAKVMAFSADPAEGSEGGEITSSVIATVSPQVIGLGGPSVTVAPPRTDADMDVMIEVAETATADQPLPISFHTLNLGPADVESYSLAIDVHGAHSFDASLLPQECTVSHSNGQELQFVCVMPQLSSGVGSEFRFAVTPLASAEATLDITAHVTDITGADDPRTENNVDEAFVTIVP